MNVAGKFEVIKESEYEKELLNNQNVIFVGYDERKTSGSAGHDIFLVRDINLKPGESMKIQTFLKCFMKEEYFLMIVPRSSIGFKHKLRFDNTVSIIDADYYGNDDNDGHIWMSITNNTDETWSFEKGTRIAQAIFVPFGICVNTTNELTKRVGGSGSTGEK